jgi:hypothetical protein
MSCQGINVRLDESPIRVTINDTPVSLKIQEVINNIKVNISNPSPVRFNIADEQPIAIQILGYAVTSLPEVIGRLITEEPAQVSSRRFQTNFTYVTDKLMVFRNGLKEKYVTQISQNEFEFEVDIAPWEEVEVFYVRS